LCLIYSFDKSQPWATAAVAQARMPREESNPFMGEPGSPPLRRGKGVKSCTRAPTTVGKLRVRYMHARPDPLTSNVLTGRGHHVYL
jgi:hypothetical protein